MFTETSPFIQYDNRKNREWNPTTAENLNARFSAMLPPAILNGCSVLDLGACIGAAGDWCLHYGASSYTAVEISEEYTSIMQKLLVKDNVTIIKTDIEEFLDANIQKFDIVILSGVIQGFVDYYKILKQVTNITKKYVCIDSLRANNDGVEYQVLRMTTAEGVFSVPGPKFSPDTLTFLFETLNFECHSMTTKLTGYTPDTMYTDNRFIAIYNQSNTQYVSATEKIKQKHHVDVDLNGD
jgi:ubiquinone/menaquinone biosynthesis C-methylase UbiE